jgi:hypothetical protein
MKQMNRIMGILMGGALLLGGVAYGQNQQGPSMGHGQMMSGAMSCGQMTGKADIRVEKTPDGAVIHMTAKDPRDITAVQERAQMMSTCMGMMKHPH